MHLIVFLRPLGLRLADADADAYAYADADAWAYRWADRCSHSRSVAYSGAVTDARPKRRGTFR